MRISIDQVKFNEQGLIPAIAQDHLTGEVRMMAWMNREAIELTQKTRKATFYSRSRKAVWVKGETSGNVLHVVDFLADCDQDTLLILCRPEGPSCHTGRDNCFFYPLLGDAEPSEDVEEPVLTPARPFLQVLESVLEQRKQSTGEKSYTRSLFDGGPKKIAAKIQEEAGEVSVAIAEESEERVASEAADVLYHLLVGLRYRDVPVSAVLEVLASRLGVSGHVEKASRSASPAPHSSSEKR